MDTHAPAEAVGTVGGFGGAGAVGGADRAERLRTVLRQHAAGVTVVTVPGPAGFTATSFTSVSLRPPLVTFFVGAGASAAPPVGRAAAFAVHLLDVEHAALAERFAEPGIDRFAGVAWTPAPGGVPLLYGPRWLTARVVLRQLLGDHLQVVGEFQDSGGYGGTGPALVRHDGGYAGARPVPPGWRP